MDANTRNTLIGVVFVLGLIAAVAAWILIRQGQPLTISALNQTGASTTPGV